MSLRDAVRQLDLAIRQAADGEAEAARRLQAAQARLAEAERRLQAVQAYAREYRERPLAAAPLAAGRLQDEQRFLLPLEHTIALQARITDQDRRGLELARAGWAAARQRRQAIEALRDERQRAGRLKQEALEQQRLDDRPRPANPLRGLGG
ncbi:MAG: flagellar FliJ family protein [Pseudomonadales bacterium]